MKSSTVVALVKKLKKTVIVKCDIHRLALDTRLRMIGMIAIWQIGSIPRTHGLVHVSHIMAMATPSPGKRLGFVMAGGEMEAFYKAISASIE